MLHKRMKTWQKVTLGTESPAKTVTYTIISIGAVICAVVLRRG